MQEGEAQKAGLAPLIPQTLEEDVGTHREKMMLQAQWYQETRY